MFFQLGVAPEKKKALKKPVNLRHKDPVTRSKSSEKKTVRIASDAHERQSQYGSVLSKSDAADQHASKSNPFVEGSNHDLPSAHFGTESDRVNDLQRSLSEVKRDQLFGPSRAQPERHYYNRRARKTKALLSKDPTDVDLHSFNSFESSSGVEESGSGSCENGQHNVSAADLAEGELALLFTSQRRGAQQAQKLIGYDHLREITAGSPENDKELLSEADGTSFSAGASFCVIRHVKICQGIATISLHYALPLHQVFAWLLLVAVVWYLLLVLVRNHVIDIHLNVTTPELLVELGSCNLQVSTHVCALQYPRVELRAWSFLFDHRPHWSVDHKLTHFDVNAISLSSFWQCSINIYLSRNSPLENITVSEKGSKQPVIISLHDIADMNLRDIAIRAHQAHVQVSDVISQGLKIDIYDGSVTAHDWRGSEVDISSAMAPVFFELRDQPLLARVQPSIAPFCVIKSDGGISGRLTHTEVEFGLTPRSTGSKEQIPTNFSYRSDAKAPLYLTLDHRDTDPFRFTSWVGSEQQNGVKLTESTAQRLNNLDEAANPANLRQPWRYIIQTTSPLNVRGHWELVSSNGLLVNQSLHTLITMGVLKADLHHATAHVLGNTCEAARAATSQFAIWLDNGSTTKITDNELRQFGTPSSTAEQQQWSNWVESDGSQKASLSALGSWKHRTEDLKHCEKFLRVNEYLVLHAQLKQTFPAQLMYSDYMLWRSAARRPGLTSFETSSGSIKISQPKWSDSVAFSLSLLISTAVSAFVLFVALKWVLHGLIGVIYTNMLRQENFEKAQSYRLNFEAHAGAAQHSWLINVYTMHRPNPAFVIYWSFKEMNEDFYQLIIVCSPERRQRDLVGELTEALSVEETSSCSSTFSNKLPVTDNDVYIYLSSTAVIMQENMKSIEIPIHFPPSSGADFYNVDTKQSWALDPDSLYRLKVIAVDATGRKINASAWSSQMAVPRVLGPNDIEPHLLRKIFPCGMSSWELFWRKCVVPQKVQHFPIRLLNVSLRVMELEERPLELQLRVAWLNAASEHAYQHRNFTMHAGGEALIRFDEHGSPTPLTLTYHSMDQKFLLFAVYDRRSNLRLALGKALLFDDHLRTGVHLSSCDAGLDWGILRFQVDQQPFRTYTNEFNPGSRSLPRSRGRRLDRPMTTSKGRSEGQVRRDSLQLQGAKSSGTRFELTCEGFQNVFPGMILCEGRDFELIWNAGSVPWKRFNLYACFMAAPSNFEEGTNYTRHSVGLKSKQGAAKRRGSGHSVTRLRRASFASDSPDQMSIDEYARICIFEKHFSCVSVKRIAQNVSNLGRFNWTPEMESESVGVVKLVITQSSNFTPGTDEKYYQSHSFVISRPLLLSELEYAYAAFCRIHNLPTMSVVQDKADGVGERLPNGVKIARADLRVCTGLRRPLPFEGGSTSSRFQSTPFAVTAGQQVITGSTKLVLQSDSAENDQKSEGHTGRYEVYKAEAKTGLPIVCDIELEQDPFWWHSSDDAYAVSVDCFPGLKIIDSLIDSWNELLIRRHGTGAVNFGEQRFIISARSRRFLLFRAWSAVWDSVVQIISVLLFFSAAVQWCGLIFVHNILKTEDIQHPHLNTDTRYLSDFVFTNSWKERCEYIFVVPAAFLVLLTVQGTLRLLFKGLLNNRQTRAITTIIVSCHLLVASVVVGSVHLILPFSLCWFIVAILLDPDTWLPPAILVVCSVGLGIHLYLKYSGAREYIREQLRQHSEVIQNLMFASYFAKKKTFADASSTANSDTEDGGGIELALQNVRRYGASLAGGDRGLEGGLAHHKRDWSTLVSWKFSKCVPGTEHGFWYDDIGQARGLAEEPSLPFGTRFATLAEDYEHNKELFQSMLIGSEVIMLLEGILSGPRFGYRTESPPIPDTHYSSAIVAIPHFPPAAMVSTELKVEVIFQSFDRDGDGRLNEIEFFLWSRILGKNILIRGHEDEMMANDWSVVVHYVNSQYRLNGNTKDGFGFQDLLSFYLSTSETTLNQDYLRIVKVDDRLTVKVTDTGDTRMPLEDHGNGSVVLGVNDLVRDSVTDAVEQAAGDWSDVKEVWGDIYQTITGSETRLQLREVTNDSTIARNMYLTQLALLVPSLGITNLLHNQGAHKSSVNALDLVGYTPPDETFQWTRLLCLAYEDTFIKITQEIVNEHNALFENVVDKMDSWIDYSLPEDIDARVRDITAVTMGLDVDLLSNFSKALLSTYPCKIACLAYKACLYRYADTEFTESKTIALIMDDVVRRKFRWSHLAQLLLDCGYIKRDVLGWHEVKNPLKPESSFSCPLFVDSAFDAFFDDIESSHPSRFGMVEGDDLVARLRGYLLRTDNVLRLVQTNYLSLPNILFLLTLLGIDLCQHRLPCIISSDDGVANACSCQGERCSCEWSYLHLNQNSQATASDHQVEYLPQSVFAALNPEQLRVLGLTPLITGAQAWDSADARPTQTFHPSRGGGQPHLTFAQNISVVKELLFSFSRGTMFLRIELADEFFKQLTCEQFHLNSLKAFLRSIGLSDDLEHYDWSKFKTSSAWDSNLNRIFTHISENREFVRRTDIPYLMRALKEYLEGRNLGSKTGFAKIRITADILHRVLVSLGISRDRQDSSTYWLLVSAELGIAPPASTMTAIQAATTLSRVIFQPVSASGAKFTGTALADIHSFVGALPFFALDFILRAMGFDMAREHQQNIWRLIPKQQIDLSWSEAARATTNIGNTDGGADDLSSDENETLNRAHLAAFPLELHFQDFVHFDVLRTFLARFLLTGLPPEGIPVLIRLCCGMNQGAERVQDVVRRHRDKLTKFGVFSAATVSELICLLHVEGINLDTWLTLIRESMDINVPRSALRQVFNVIDVNQNK